VSGLRSGAHECQIRSAPVLVLPRLQRFSITLKEGRQRTKIKIILALCQQSGAEKQFSAFFLFFPLTDVRMFDNLRVVKMNRNPHAMSQ